MVIENLLSGSKGGKLYSIALLSLLLVMVFTLPAAAATIEMNIGQSTMWVDGSSVRLDAAPYIKDGRTMVPLSAIARAFGAQVSAYSDESGLQARIDYRNVRLFLLVGDKGAHFVNEMGNDTVVHMDVAPEIRNSRMFVPLGFIAQGFGASVNWNAASQAITIGDGIEADGTNTSNDLSAPATYLPNPGMQLRYYRNYPDGDSGYETVYTQEASAASGAVLHVAEVADEYRGSELYNHHYVAGGDGIYEYYDTNSEEADLLPWLKDSLYTGKTWSYTGDYGSIYWKVTALDQTITIGDLIFEQCLVVQVDNQAVGWKFERCYAPGLGLIRERSLPDGQLTARLESW